MLEIVSAYKLPGVDLYSSLLVSAATMEGQMAILLLAAMGWVAKTSALYKSSFRCKATTNHRLGVSVVSTN